MADYDQFHDVKTLNLQDLSFKDIEKTKLGVSIRN